MRSATRSFWRKMRKSLGSKRREMSEEDIATVTRLFGDFVEARLARVFDADGKEVGSHAPYSELRPRPQRRKETT